MRVFVPNRSGRAGSTVGAPGFPRASAFALDIPTCQQRKFRRTSPPQIDSFCSRSAGGTARARTADGFETSRTLRRLTSGERPERHSFARAFSPRIHRFYRTTRQKIITSIIVTTVIVVDGSRDSRGFYYWYWIFRDPFPENFDGRTQTRRRLATPPPLPHPGGLVEINFRAFFSTSTGSAITGWVRKLFRPPLPRTATSGERTIPRANCDSRRSRRARERSFLRDQQFQQFAE